MADQSMNAYDKVEIAVFRKANGLNIVIIHLNSLF